MRVLCLLPLYCALLFSFALPAAGATDEKTSAKEEYVYHCGGMPPLFYLDFFSESFRASELREYVEDTYSYGNYVQPPDCNEPLPLVAYVFLDRADMTRTYERYPAYVGYLVLEKKDGRMQYAWTAKAPGRGGRCLEYIGHPEEDMLPCFFVCPSERQHCEFAPGATCASFFLWMKGYSLFYPMYRIFFTAGSPPDAAWIPEFDATETPDHRRILKNPLPGMRPAPWYPPDQEEGFIHPLGDTKKRLPK